MSHAEKPRRGTVWWDDAHGGGSESFDHKDIDGKHVPWHVGSTGWVIRDDAKGVSIAQSWNPEQKEMTGGKWDYREHSFYPRGIIKKVEYLDPPRRKK